jgi:nucleotide sugar dehydrogenase
MVDPKIAVIGSGYVGLVDAACLSKKYRVICNDIDGKKIEQINAAHAPFYEPKLNDVLKKSVMSGNLTATNDLNEALQDASLILISVGTPSMENGEIMLDYVSKAAEGIAKNLDHYSIIVTRSTVIPGTTNNIVKKTIERISGLKDGVDFGVAFVPEFLREGNAVDDFMKPDRIVIGSDDGKVVSYLKMFFKDFYDGFPSDKIIAMSTESAELVKYSSNAFLAIKISFANEMAELAEKIPGVDVVDVMNAVGLDNRIGRKFLGVGAGFGGACLPKDLKALKHFSYANDVKPMLVEAALQRNDLQANHIVELASKELGDLSDKRIAILGLSFKPETSDIREAPSLKIIQKLLNRGATNIIACDPKAIDGVKSELGNKIEYTTDPDIALRGADCAIVVTEWEIFKRIGTNKFTELMNKPVVIDGRRIYPAKDFEKKIKLISIGRNS